MRHQRSSVIVYDLDSVQTVEELAGRSPAVENVQGDVRPVLEDDLEFALRL